MTVIHNAVSNKIANASFIAALTVVMTHFPRGTSGAVHIVYAYFPGGFLGFAVPFFFVISGYLLAGHCGEHGWWWDALKSRCKTLLVPYCVLNVLFGFWKLMYVYYLCPKMGIAGGGFTWWEIPGVIGLFPDKGPAIGPLWYVRSLLMFVVVSPLLVWLVRRSVWVCLVAMAAVLASWTPNAFSYGSLFKFYFNGLGLVCFAGGILLRMRGDRVLTILQSKMIGIIAICVGWVILAFVHRQELYAVRMIGYFATMIGLFALTPAGRWPKLLTANSFPIYVFHAVILHFLTLALRWVGWGRWPENVFANVVCFVFVVASCCLLAAGIRAIPRLRGLLLGGR